MKVVETSVKNLIWLTIIFLKKIGWENSVCKALKIQIKSFHQDLLGRVSIKC
jgi:hypothetical protein